MNLLIKKFKNQFNEPSKSGGGQEGFVALFIAVVVLALIFALAIPLIVLVLGQQRIVSNLTRSNQAYFAAEAGIEDALLRLKRAMNWNSSYFFSIENSSAEIIISDAVGGARTITATGNASGRFRRVQVAYELSGLTPGLFYGAQAGNGGLVMENHSSVIGNVFSNGSVHLKGPQSEITNTVIVANAGNKIFGRGRVGEDAYVDICQGDGPGGNRVTVTETLYSNTITNCNYNLLETPIAPIDPVLLPIDDLEIEKWKSDAAAGGIIGSYSISSGTHHLGPVKIDGDLVINAAELIVEGTILVTGNITISQPQTRVRLDPSYGSMSGVIIGEGLINLEVGAVSSGSGTAGSYLMYISTSPANPAIVLGQHSKVDILYSNTGWVSIHNNTDMRSINAYGINVANNATLEYEIGLADALFTSGPGAGWKVTSWREIE